MTLPILTKTGTSCENSAPVDLVPLLNLPSFEELPKSMQDELKGFYYSKDQFLKMDASSDGDSRLQVEEIDRYLKSHRSHLNFSTTATCDEMRRLRSLVSEVPSVEKDFEEASRKALVFSLFVALPAAGAIYKLGQTFVNSATVNSAAEAVWNAPAAAISRLGAMAGAKATLSAGTLSWAGLAFGAGFLAGTGIEYIPHWLGAEKSASDGVAWCIEGLSEWVTGDKYGFAKWLG